jgi:hypothetical protein
MALSFCDGLRLNRMWSTAMSFRSLGAPGSAVLSTASLTGPLFSIRSFRQTPVPRGRGGLLAIRGQVSNRMKYFRANLILGGVFFPAVRP